MVDIFSRKIVGREAHEREGAELAAVLIRQAVGRRLYRASAGPARRQWQPDERRDVEGDAGKTGHHGPLHPPARDQRQPVLRGAVPNLQISPGTTGKTRNWQPAGPVWLNPENETSVLRL